VFEVGKATEKNRTTLVRTPSGKTILVDTGSDASILRALGESLPEWQRAIDTVILTSGEETQAGGLPDIMSRYRVANLIRFGTQGSKSFESALAAAASTDLHQTTAPYGSSLNLDTTTHITVISPGTFDIFYDTNSLSISSTTPTDIYILSGKTITKK
jgi:beta-lactamase superfamily II metal-dependent hydrolase